MSNFRTWHCEAIIYCGVKIFSQSADRLQYVQVDSAIVSVNRFVQVNQNNFTEHETASSKVDGLHQLAFHCHQALSNARWLDYMAGNSGETGCFEFAYVIGVFATCLIHLFGELSTDDVDDEFTSFDCVAQGILGGSGATGRSSFEAGRES